MRTWTHWPALAVLARAWRAGTHVVKPDRTSMPLRRPQVGKPHLIEIEIEGKR